jgi:hypothetical protein
MSQPALLTSQQPPPLPADDIIVLRDATWADYQRLLEMRGERPVPRLTYVLTRTIVAVAGGRGAY